MDSEFLQHMEEQTNMLSKSELKRYWLESNEDPKTENFDLLTWWSVNCTKYPILSQMERDILAILVSTAASESNFSTRRRILDPYRASLSPEMAEVLVLICAQNGLRHPSKISLRDILDEWFRKHSRIHVSPRYNLKKHWRKDRSRDVVNGRVVLLESNMESCCCKGGVAGK